jgi:hypothetical protein
MRKIRKLLLHTCCAPCASGVLERIVRDYDVTVLWYNPNIVPKSEHNKRLSHLQRFMRNAHPNVPIIVGEYCVFTPNCCEECFTARFEETAKIAVSHGFDLFTTTLTLSSKKNADVINELSAIAAEKYSTERLWADFKKNDGYNRSIELCNRYKIYRQDYCGCKNENENKN